MRRRRGYQPMRSNFETQVSAKLDELGIKYEYEAYKLEYFKPLRDAVCFECENAKVYQRRTYLPDFWLPDHGFFIEAKGKFGQVDRMKMRLVKEYHPDEDIRMVFMRNNRIGKKAQTETRYIDYAAKYGIPGLVLENIEEFFQ